MTSPLWCGQGIYTSPHITTIYNFVTKNFLTNRHGNIQLNTHHKYNNVTLKDHNQLIPQCWKESIGFFLHLIKVSSPSSPNHFCPISLSCVFSARSLRGMCGILFKIIFCRRRLGLTIGLQSRAINCFSFAIYNK